MRQIGFSTGALAYGDFQRGLAMIHRRRLPAIELSALRQNELMPLLDALPTLDLSEFNYISIHAPSQFEPELEATLWQRLSDETWRDWPIVVHPDTLYDFSLWRELGSRICVENMDKRKPVGRSAHELASIFKKLPDASLCFDIGHARQYDSTMTEGYLILREFRAKLRQVHVSEVNTSSRHDPLSYASILAFQEVAHLIPGHVPLILETPVGEDDIEIEIAKVREALPLDQHTMVA
jgi:Xylose isomerase-like TIM barrel